MKLTEDAKKMLEIGNKHAEIIKKSSITYDGRSYKLLEIAISRIGKKIIEIMKKQQNIFCKKDLAENHYTNSEKMNIFRAFDTLSKYKIFIPVNEKEAKKIVGKNFDGRNLYYTLDINNPHISVYLK